MAVAVKNSPEVGTSSMFDRLPVICLAGVAYVLGCLGIVFKLLPSLVGPVLAGLGLRGPADAVVLALLMVAAATVLIVVGLRLLGPNAPAGARAGIFSTFVGLLLIIGLTRWASLWIEHWVYHGHLFGSSGPLMGSVLTAAIGIALLLLAIRWLFKRSTENLLIGFENQGWFSSAAYKPQQGQRVRRGTIIGLLIVAITGVYTLINHGTLRKGSPNWEVNLPFTGMVRIDHEGDVGPHLKLDARSRVAVVEDGKEVERPVINRFELRDINDEWADSRKFVKVAFAGRSEALRGKEGTIVPRAEFDRESQTLEDEFKQEVAEVRDESKLAAEREHFENNVRPRRTDPEPAGGTLKYTGVTLLPSVQYTLPLILLAGSLWLAWRIVNYPSFADFLIATEAELNKVSWTTRKRLVQDTIVVLATLVLMSVFLFGVDQTWRIVLSWKPIGVLQFYDEQTDANRSVEEKPW